MKGKISPLPLGEKVGTRCVPIFLPDDDLLVARFNAQAFKYLSSPSYYLKLPGAGENSRIWEKYRIKNLNGGDCVVLPKSSIENMYIIPPNCVGQVKVFASGTPPANHLRCDGAEYNKIDYPELYERISPVFRNGDKFRVPDMRSRVSTDGVGMGNVVGKNYRMQAPSEIALHRHGIDSDTQTDTAEHNHGGSTQISAVPHNHGGSTQISAVPHDHGGITSDGLAAFYRTVSQSGLSTNDNHVTGFVSSQFTDKTDTKWPMRSHKHKIENDNAQHSHDIDDDSITHNHVISVDLAPHKHSIVTLTENWPLDTPQIAMDMRQETISLEHYICCASERISDMTMYYLRRNGNAIEQTRNGGADWSFLWELCSCNTGGAIDPYTGQQVTVATATAAAESNINVGQSVVDGTYDEGNYGDSSIYSDAVINNAICAALSLWVNATLDIVSENYTGEEIELCSFTDWIAISGVLAGISSAAAAIPQIATIAFAASVASAFAGTVCEFAEEIAEILQSNPAFLKDQAARNEVACAMFANVKAPLNFTKWQSSLIGFSGSSNAEKIAEVLSPMLLDPALYGEFWNGAQEYVEIADTQNLPCICDAAEDCPVIRIDWSNIPLNPPLPGNWSVSPDLDIFAPYETIAFVSRDINGDITCAGFLGSPPESIGLMYNFDNQCLLTSVRGTFETSANSYRAAIYAKEASTQTWVKLVQKTRTGAFVPLKFDLMKDNLNVLVDAVVWSLWGNEIRLTDVGVN